MNRAQLGANTSCLYDLLLPEAIQQLRDLGFKGITLLGFADARHSFGELAGFWFRDMGEAERDGLKRLLASFDRRAIHAPFVDMPLVSHDPRLEQLTRDRIQESIEAAEYLGCQVVIVHANSRPNYPLPEYWDSLVAALESLGDYAARRGVKIGLETGFPRGVDEFVDLLEAVGHHAVGATLDVGHMQRYVDSDLWGTPPGAKALNDLLIDMTRQLGPTIVHCQLHDVDLPGWRDHRAVGRGVIEFEPFLAELESLDYQGMLELELEEKDALRALVESRNRVEAILWRPPLGRQAA